MAESCVATIPDLMPHRRLRPPAADPPRHWNTTQPSPTSATHIGKRLAGKLHEPFERAGGGRAISPTSPDSTALISRLCQNLAQRRPQPGVIVGDDELDAVQTAGLEPAQEAPPTRAVLAVGQLARQPLAPSVPVDADRN